MNLRFVEAFYWVVTLKSVTRAAEKLHLSQSAMSSRVASLEVMARADELMLRSEIFEAGRWVTYQQGPVARIRPLQGLVDGARRIGHEYRVAALPLVA